MAAISGKVGSIDFTNAQTYIRNWTINLVADTYDTSVMEGVSSGRSFIAGIKGWSGSFECNYSTGNTAVPGDSGTIICRSSTATGGVFMGTAILTGMDVSVPVDGLVTQSYTFQGSDGVAQST